MTSYEALKLQLIQTPSSWLVTGGAGFIGSHLAETLLKLNQRVICLDDFSTGRQRNLEDVRGAVSPGQWKNCQLVTGDIRCLDTCRRAAKGVDYILHQAALASVPGSIADPAAANAVNVTGFLNVLIAAREAKVKRVVYASSSAVYGNDPVLPKSEQSAISPLSPYAVTKYANELYAQVFSRCYPIETIGLRYFNIFGPRQDENGPYSAVIPKWINTIAEGQQVKIYGDGETSRDFCYVDDAVQMNLLSGATANADAVNQVYNVAGGQSISLNGLYSSLKMALAPRFKNLRNAAPLYQGFREGDVRHSHADIAKASKLLGYLPTVGLPEGLAPTIDWYLLNRNSPHQ